MKNIKCIAFDIDGTLLKHGQTVIDQDVKDAIKQLKDKGIHIVVSTGRASYFIQDDVIKTLQPDFFVTINGHLVVDKDFNPVYGKELDRREAHLMIDTARAKGFGLGIKAEKSVEVYHDYDDFYKTYLHGDYSKLHILENKSQQKYPEVPIYGCFMIGNEADILSLESSLSKSLLSYAYPNAFEAIDKKAGKADGLNYVVDYYGIDWDEVMTFGDANNDIPMLQKAGIGVAMGNGRDDAKASADFVTKPIDEGGVVFALKHYGLID